MKREELGEKLCINYSSWTLFDGEIPEKSKGSSCASLQKRYRSTYTRVFVYSRSPFLSCAQGKFDVEIPTCLRKKRGKIFPEILMHRISPPNLGIRKN